jgi:mannose-1-phosphate guanylyltransferase
MSNVFALIMAGGSGTRFWPRSRELRPKQFHSVFNDKTLIESTVNRFLALIPKENIYIISKLLHKEEMDKNNLSIPGKNILYEPSGKNTLPCIGLAVLYIQQIYPEGIMVVSPADHIVGDPEQFGDTIENACNIALKYNGIVTVGITPDHPATGYGYIRSAAEIETGSELKAFKVNRFVEKPDIKAALEYISSGEYFWNSGIFVFKCSVLWEAIRRFAPEIYNSLAEIKNLINIPSNEAEINRIYNSINGNSIDYAIMEKADNVYVIRGNFPWNDLGTWEQVYELTEKDEFNNAASGEVLFEDTSGTYACSQNGIIALVGVKDLIVVQEGNATLVCQRGKAEEVKKLVERLKTLGLKEYI